jgi:hypothetical protein
MVGARRNCMQAGDVAAAAATLRRRQRPAAGRNQRLRRHDDGVSLRRRGRRLDEWNSSLVPNALRRC